VATPPQTGEELSESEKPAQEAGFAQAADGTRTHDLLHGKQWLSRVLPLSSRIRGVGDGRGLHAITGSSGNQLVTALKDARLSEGSGHFFTVETDARNSSAARASPPAPGAIAVGRKRARAYSRSPTALSASSRVLNISHRTILPFSKA
jgi:hypothetical protein